MAVWHCNRRNASNCRLAKYWPTLTGQSKNPNLRKYPTDNRKQVLSAKRDQFDSIHSLQTILNILVGTIREHLAENRLPDSAISGSHESFRSLEPCVRCTLLALILVGVVGCASWSETPVQTETSSVHAASLPGTGTVDIETMIIRFSSDQAAELEEIWDRTDETTFESAQRRALDANGIRAGVLRGELPAVLVKQLNHSAQQKSLDVGEASGLGSDADARMRLIRCRTGGRKELIVRREINRPLSVVTSIDGVLSGQTFYDQPATLFALTPHALNDGTAKIEMVPEVQYGQSQNRYITTDFGMKQEAKRPTKIWKELKLSTTLAKGDVLVIASTQPTKSLGGAFFLSENLQETEEHLVLLIRLSETPIDDLFDSQLN